MIGSLGVHLVGTASAMIDRSAAEIARGTTPRGEASSVSGMVAAASDLVVGRFLFRTGLALVTVERETDRALLDVVA